MKKSKAKGLRKFGVKRVGNVPWGTHLCQFYQTKKDLVDILVPYFKAGLEGNEFCMWVTAEPLEVEEAKKAMAKAVPNFAEYLKRRQIEILSYRDWYVKGGKFDCDRVLSGWVSKLEAALKKGYDGLRLTGNTFWLEKKDWKAFTDYEEAVNNVIGKYRMIAVCTYSLDRCNANEIVDVIRNHQFALIKRSGKWELIESAEKKQIAEDLLRTEQKFTNLYNSMTEGVALHEVIYDSAGKAVDYVILDVNPSFEKITMLSKKQAAGKRASKLYGTEAPPYLDVYAKVAASGKPTLFETYFPPMKKYFSISVVSPSKGKFNTIFNDITESKQAEEALRASEQRWATTLTSIGDAVIATDVEGRITFMNRVAEKLTGWTLEESAKKPLKNVFKIINERTRKTVANPVAKVLEKGAIVGLANHTILICKDGTEIPIDDSGAPIRDEDDKVKGVVLVFRDITERKRTGTELRETKDYLESLFNYANAPIIVWDPSFRITRFNHAFERLTGLSSNDVIGKTLDILFPPDTRKKSMAHIKRTLKGEYWETVEIPVRYIDGSVKTLLWNSANIYDSDGKKIVATIAQGHDITERKKTLAALRESQRDLKRAQAVARTGSWRLDVKRNVLLWSDETYRMFAVPKGTPLTYERFLGDVHPDDRAEVDRRWQAALRGEPYDIEHRIIVNGQVKCVREKAELEFDDDGTLHSAFGTVQDVTDAVRLREKLEDSAVQLEEYSNQMEQLANERAEKLKASEKLAAIGATAGMVGHDIRNPLQAIIGDLYLVKSDLNLMPEGREKESMKESLIAIEESVDYIDKIVQDLQDYARPLKPTLQETDIEELCMEVLEKDGLPKNITSSCQVKKDAKKIISDNTLLRRILTNLKNNAVQAMPNGGKLEFHAYKEADDIVITVQDTGVGIPEGIKSQLFTPLFTTKSKGQGFGLPVVKRMTEALHGTVTFESEEGKGTKFTVRLPQKEETAT